MEPLYQAALMWERITHYRYEITYGYKKQLHTIELSFSPEDFPHVAGFQYLNDIQIGKFSPKRTVSKILEGAIRQEQVEKAAKYYTLVEPRLMAVNNLEEALDKDFSLFSYKAEFLPFYSQIKADYLASSELNGMTFVFLIHSGREDDDFACCTAFIKGARDYALNQRKLTVLRKLKIETTSGERTVLFERDGFTE